MCCFGGGGGDIMKLWCCNCVSQNAQQTPLCPDLERLNISEMGNRGQWRLPSRACEKVMPSTLGGAAFALASTAPPVGVWPAAAPAPARPSCD